MLMSSLPFRIGGFFLDQPWAAEFRVVRQPADSTGDRAGRKRRCSGPLPGHAHVHHQRIATNRPEGGWSAIGARFALQQGIGFYGRASPVTSCLSALDVLGQTRLDHRPKNAHQGRSSQLGQSFPAVTGSRQRSGHRFLLRPAATRLWIVQEVRRFWIHLSEGGFLRGQTVLLPLPESTTAII